MTNNENWMDAFRTKNRENVYVLKVTLIEDGKEVKNISEVVDCPKGEVGVWYANNLLCRLANEILRGTKIEKCQWGQYHSISHEADTDYIYKKIKDSQNEAMAEMKWYEQLPEEKI